MNGVSMENNKVKPPLVKYTSLNAQEVEALKPIQNIVPKSWGYEHWIVNNEEYCGKILFIEKGNQSSWHYHLLKHETLYVQSGKLLIKYNDNDNLEQAKEIILNQGERMVVYRGLRHRLIALEPTQIIEFSSQHFDTDSIRIG
jgi:quercetin dioxygenase-like cupin family protein